MSRLNSSHTVRRVWLYLLLWMISVSLLGLTAYRVSFTRKNLRGRYEPIVAYILATSVLTVIWAPIAFFLLFKNRLVESRHNPKYKHEMIGSGLLWLMWLVGAAYYTNRIIPGKNYCPVGMMCSILVAILALTWTGWALLTIILILALMHHSAAHAVSDRHGDGLTTSTKTGRH